MHIIMRYELEKGLVEGSIKVEDLPRLWNEVRCAVPGAGGAVAAAA